MKLSRFDILVSFSHRRSIVKQARRLAWYEHDALALWTHSISLLNASCCNSHPHLTKPNQYCTAFSISSSVLIKWSLRQRNFLNEITLTGFFVITYTVLNSRFVVFPMPRKQSTNKALLAGEVDNMKWSNGACRHGGHYWSYLTGTH